jgi:hypothetical protein
MVCEHLRALENALLEVGIEETSLGQRRRNIFGASSFAPSLSGLGVG